MLTFMVASSVGADGGVADLCLAGTSGEELMTRDARDRNVDGFGRWADSYDRSVLQRLLFAPVHDCMLGQTATMCPALSSVLDIGSGTGLLLRKAAERFPSAQLTGIDAAEDMVRVARALVPEGAPVHFAQAFAEQLPFPDASFDLVVTSMSFHHWADQQKALSEARRVLSPGGVFVLADLLAAGPAGIFLAGGRWGHFKSPAALDEMLRGTGFHVERFVRVPKVPGCVQVALARRAHPLPYLAKPTADGALVPEDALGA
jgi:ubiquinone/menaquinone biosynthesis C-methylase UbiE